MGENAKRVSHEPSCAAIEQRAAVQLGLVLSIKWNEQAETGRVQIDCQSLEQLTLILDKLGLSDER